MDIQALNQKIAEESAFVSAGTPVESGISISIICPGIASFGTVERTAFPVLGCVTWIMDLPGFALAGTTVLTLVMAETYGYSRIRKKRRMYKQFKIRLGHQLTQ